VGLSESYKNNITLSRKVIGGRGRSTDEASTNEAPPSLWAAYADNNGSGNGNGDWYGISSGHEVPSFPEACDDARWMARSNGSGLLEEESWCIGLRSTSFLSEPLRPPSGGLLLCTSH
jgi:hypothetical protein